MAGKETKKFVVVIEDHYGGGVFATEDEACDYIQSEIEGGLEVMDIEAYECMAGGWLQGLNILTGLRLERP